MTSHGDYSIAVLQVAMFKTFGGHVGAQLFSTAAS